MRTLEYLHDRKGEETSLRDIEAHLRVAHPTVVGLVKRLESKGFVAVAVGERDHRFRQVDITEKGVGLCEETMQISKEIESKLTKGLTKREVAQLETWLVKMYENISDLP